LNDKSLGVLIFIMGIVGAVGYVYWLFAPALDTDPLFYVPVLKVRWAIVLPVLGLVLALFFLAVWIGWTMVIAPPPVIDGRVKKDDKADETRS
jgi:hypothetical protein